MVPPIDAKYIQSAKKGRQMRYNQFQSRKIHIYARILATVLLIETKKPPYFKKRTANAVKQVSKSANTRFCVSPATVPPIDAKNLQSSKNIR